MLGKRHKKYGGGLGGTTSNSVMTAYATVEQMEAEQRSFRRAIIRQQLLDQTLATRVLGKPRHHKRRGDSTRG